MSLGAPGLFITGTDTGVGKTVVSAALVSLLRMRGVDAVPMKPVQTGCRRQAGQWRAPDLEFCLRMAGLTASRAHRRQMAPYCFKPACSPHLAAAIQRRRIEITPVVDAFHALQRRHSFVIAEGAGGILAPLNERETMLDLMAALVIPVVLVARPGLGTINHTLLSLRELRRARLTVAGVIFNQTQKKRGGLVERDNIAVIERQGQVRVLGRLPFIVDWNRKLFLSFCGRHFDTLIPWMEHMVLHNNAVDLNTRDKT